MSGGRGRTERGKKVKKLYFTFCDEHFFQFCQRDSMYKLNGMKLAKSDYV